MVVISLTGWQAGEEIHRHVGPWPTMAGKWSELSRECLVRILTEGTDWVGRNVLPDVWGGIRP